MTLPADRTTTTDAQAFAEHGYVQLTGMFTAQQVEAFRRLREQATADWRYTHGTAAAPPIIGDLLERSPRAILPAVAHPRLLDLAEAIMGPVAQLDSAVLASFPPQPNHRNEPVMWHRDRFGYLPPDAYVRPLALQVLAYLQPLTTDIGPLRVLPGSHRHPRMLDDHQRYERIPGETLIHAQPGDAVVLHHNLLHSGTHNTSPHQRQFLGISYSNSAHRHEDNFDGPNCRALRDTARRCHDRRLQRLLGDDPFLSTRHNSGFTADPDRDWAQWQNEDRQHAAMRTDEQATVATARAQLSIPAGPAQPG